MIFSSYFFPSFPVVQVVLVEIFRLVSKEGTLKTLLNRQEVHKSFLFLPSHLHCLGHRKEKEICSTFEIDFYLLEVTNFKLTFRCLKKQQPEKTADILRR